MQQDNTKRDYTNKLRLLRQRGRQQTDSKRTVWDTVEQTFNQGVTGSRPVRPKLNRPSLPGIFEENQGVKTLGQPTP